MGLEVMEQAADYARRGGFDAVDITGGAPEMNPDLKRLIELMRPLTPRLMLRANLTALNEPGREDLAPFLADNQVVIVASLPAPSASQTDAQRGRGVFQRSLAALKRLNQLGYGSGGLELDMVSNPAGAFLPPAQDQAERRFKRALGRGHDVRFDHLYTFANTPLGRFRDWLKATDNYDAYLEKLTSAFNPCAVEGLMCRNTVSLAWDGYLYDCDFNLAAGLHLGGVPTHVSDTPGPPPEGSPIAVGEHCFTCTAGSGFT
jgi:radical SAM/Cys-rich protein